MFAYAQWKESSPSVGTGKTASSNVLTGNIGSGSAAGVFSKAGLDEVLGLLVQGELTQDSGGTLDVYVQSFLAGHWYDVVHFKQLASGSTKFRYAFVAGPGYTQNSVTQGMDDHSDGITLAADTVVGGPWGEELRLWMEPGAGAAGGTNNVIVTLWMQLPRMYHPR